MARRSLTLLSLIGFFAVLLVIPGLGDEQNANEGELKEPVFAPPVESSRVGGLELGPSQNADSDYMMFRRLVDVMDQVERKYVKDISREELLEAAIRGVLEKLDPHSNYIAPKDLPKFRQDIESQFGGIGIQVGMRNRVLTILSPIVGSPAYRAGVHAGDQIVEIEGKPTKGISLDEAVRRMKGKAGTRVSFTTLRPDTNKRRVVTVKREIIRVETVLADTRNDDDSWNFMYDKKNRIGYIRITAFSRDTSRRLRRALNELRDDNVRGLILDLRFNPGGLLTSAIEICDMFIDEGRIVSTKNREKRVRKWDATKRGTMTDFPLAVLVNRYSASASEIVSACLQDHKRAIVVGERSWGKGSVQNVMELEGGGALKLTIETYYRPSGKNIHKHPGAKDSDEWGVTPDEGYRMRLSDSEMRKLLQYRRDRDVVRAKPDDKKPPAKDPQADGPENKPPNPEDGDNEFLDRQLQKAFDYLTTKLAKADSGKD